MFTSIDVLKESFANKDKIRYKDNSVSVTESILDNTLDSIFDKEVDQFSKTIKDTLIEESNKFWINESTNNTSSTIDPREEFNKALKFGIIQDAVKNCNNILNRINTYMSSIGIKVNNIHSNADIIKSCNTPLQFLNKSYSYTNLHCSMMHSSIAIDLSKVNSYMYIDITYKSLNKLDFITLAKKFIPLAKSRKEFVEDLFKYYRDNKSEPTLDNSVISPMNLEYRLDESYEYNTYIDQLRSDIKQFITDITGQFDTIFAFDYVDKYYTDPIVSQVLSAYIEPISSIINGYVLDFSARADAIIEYIETNNAILLSAIDQIKGDTVSDYDVPDNTLEDIDVKLDIQDALGEALYAINYYDSIVTLESAGLFIVNEEVNERLMYYFSRISNEMGKVIDKIQDVIRRKIAERINPVLAKLKSPDKPLPAFTINNYKTFSFDYIDAIKPEEFDYAEMKDVLKSKQDFLHRYYPTVADPQEKNIYKIIMKKYVMQQSKKECTPEILNEFIDFITVDYSKHLEGISDFRVAIDQASEQVTTIAKQYDAAGEKDTQENIQKQNQIDQTSESVIITEEPKATTSFDDQPAARDGGEGDTGLMKACTLYCSVMTQLLTSRIKIVNYAYNDRMKIVWHYVVKNKFNKEEQ